MSDRGKLKIFLTKRLGGIVIDMNAHENQLPELLVRKVAKLPLNRTLQFERGLVNHGVGRKTPILKSKTP